jgi:hypothetical protein
VDTDSQGNVYVADMHNDRIQVFISNCTFIKICGTEGKVGWPIFITRRYCCRFLIMSKVSLTTRYLYLIDMTRGYDY